MTIAEVPHGHTRYQRGCRCGVCREANRKYARRYRRSKIVRAVPDVSESGSSGAPDPAAVGIVTAAVRAQLVDLDAGVDRPALAAIAEVLARDLDDQSAVPQHPAIAHRLTEVLMALAKSSTRGRRRLAAVRGLTDQ